MTTAHDVSAFFAMSLDLMCVVGLDGHFSLLNPAWESTLGTPVEDLCATPYLDLVHPDAVSYTHLTLPTN